MSVPSHFYHPILREMLQVTALSDGVINKLSFLIDFVKDPGHSVLFYIRYFDLNEHDSVNYIIYQQPACSSD